MVFFLFRKEFDSILDGIMYAGITSLGFAATLPILNVDAFIVRQNIQRAVDDQELDIHYFTQLSDDALPALRSAFHSDALPASVKDGLGAALVCDRRNARKNPDTDWRSFHFSRSNQALLLDSLTTELKGYQVNDNDWPVTITTPLGKTYNCSGSSFMD